MIRFIAPLTAVLLLLGAFPASSDATRSPQQQAVFSSIPKTVTEPKCAKDWIWQKQDCTARDVHRQIAAMKGTDGAALLEEYKRFVNVVLAACASTLRAGKKCKSLENLKVVPSPTQSALFVRTLLVDSNIDGKVANGAIKERCVPAMKNILLNAIKNFKLRSDGLRSLDTFTEIMEVALIAADVRSQPTTALQRVVLSESLVKAAILKDKDGNDILKALGKQFMSSAAIFAMESEIKTACL